MVLVRHLTFQVLMRTLGVPTIIFSRSTGRLRSLLIKYLAQRAFLELVHEVLQHSDPKALLNYLDRLLAKKKKTHAIGRFHRL